MDIGLMRYQNFGRREELPYFLKYGISARAKLRRLEHYT